MSLENEIEDAKLFFLNQKTALPTIVEHKVVSENERKNELFHGQKPVLSSF